MVKRPIDRSFNPVTFVSDRVTIGGGYSTKPVEVQSKTVLGPDKLHHVFVKMARGEKWVLRCVCGSPKQIREKTTSRRMTLIDIMRTKIRRLCDGLDNPGNVQHSATNDDDYDPMEDLADASVIKGKSDSKRVVGVYTKGRARYYAMRRKDCIVTVNLPMQCREIAPLCQKMRPAKVFIVDRRTIWLSVDDVPWAIRWLFDEQQVKGTHVMADDDAGLEAVATPRSSD